MEGSQSSLLFFIVVHLYGSCCVSKEMGERGGVHPKCCKSVCRMLFLPVNKGSSVLKCDISEFQIIKPNWPEPLVS